MELARSTSHGGLSVRSIFTFVLAVLFTATLWAIFASPATHAADASWSGSSIVYDGNQYNVTTDSETLKAVGLESAGKVYIFVDPDLSSGSFNNSSSTSPPADRKIRVIYFENTVDSSTATEAKYKDLTYVSKGNYTSPSAVKTLSFAQTGAEGSTSCTIDTGLGWIICPITTTLATAMDFIYNILTGFLKVRPIETGQDNALYRAWKYMQAFANIAFVVVFLIIIYSQITNAGISNYGLKKLLPRLIIAALLVNLSYFISSIAVDISNVLGYSLQDIFVTMRNSLVGDEGNGWQLINWESLTGFALSGGTLAVAGGTAAFIAVSDLGPYIVFLILPALVIALLSVLVALVVLAARQAIIIILVILSPLAFVAYLLPNTEKWFGKWRDTFFTMLFIFPAFAVVFGGSQLAATAIIQTADSINLVILGMLVQVAPLFITPLLIKLGGGILSRIAGIINDPSKGMVDRTRNFVKDRTDNARARRLDTANNKAKRYQLMKRNAQYRDRRRRVREGYKTAHTAGADAGWANTPEYQKISHLEHYAHDYKAAGEGEAALHHERSRVSDPRMKALDTRMRILNEDTTGAKADAEAQWHNSQDARVIRSRLNAKQANVYLDEAKNLVEAQIEEVFAGKTGKLEQRFKISGIDTYSQVASRSLIKSKAYATRITNAQAQQTQEYALALKADAALRGTAGGILDHGATKALASANATIDQALEEAIKNIQTTSEVPAGKVDLLQKKLHEAVATQDTASIVAYINKLGESQNFGINALRNELMNLEGNGLSGDLLTTVKQFINANSTINPADESIGSWSRDPDNRSLREVVADGKTWNDMTPTAFAVMKKSAQNQALRAKNPDGSWAIDVSRINAILSNPQAKGSLKPSVREWLEDIQAHKDNPNYRPTDIWDDSAAASDDD